MEARYYNRLADHKVICHLCPHHCTITNGKSGICRVRTNNDGVLMADNYGELSAISFDPVEKKPLYHFHPGTELLSLGAFGCNFKCTCCQNYSISQTGKNEFPRSVKLSVQDVVDMACQNPNNIGIAYTYNEPSVWYEYMIDIAAISSEKGYKNAMISNGFIESSPLEELLNYIDAFNIDVKTFDEKSHKKFTSGSLKPVLDTLEKIYTAHKHLEITFLLIPGINDDLGRFDKMLDWISKNLSQHIPLHISRYFPKYKMTKEATSQSLLLEASNRAKDKLSFVYLGNIITDEMQNTICPGCNKLVIERRGYYIRSKDISASGMCNFCGFPIVSV